MSDLTDLGNSIARAMQHMDAWDTPGDLIADLADEGLALVPAAEWERSRYKGCGSYPRAIGEIEALLGITGEVPLAETVDAVRKLKSDVPTPEERAVLEAARVIDHDLLEDWAAKPDLEHVLLSGKTIATPFALRPLAEAELARRAAKEKTGG